MKFTLRPDTRSEAERINGVATGRYLEVPRLRPAAATVDTQRAFNELISAAVEHIARGRFHQALDRMQTLAHWYKAACPHPRILPIFRREFDELCQEIVSQGAAHAHWGDQAKVIRAWWRFRHLDRTDRRFDRILPARGSTPIEQQLQPGDELITFKEEKKPPLDD